MLTRTLLLPPLLAAASLPGQYAADTPAGENFKIRSSFTLPVDAQILTIGGHAHYICREMQVFATPPNGGKKKSIFYIDNWAFNWQNRYQYAKPLTLRRGTKVDVVITYDNSTDNPSNPNDPPKRIRWGLQSTDEMGSVTLLMVAKRERQTTRLKRAIRAAARESMRSGSSAGGLLGAAVSRIKMLDKNGDGKIDPSEIPSRWRSYVKRIDTNGDGALDEEELEALASGRVRRR